MNRKSKALVTTVLLVIIVTLTSWANAIPNWKIPLEGGHKYKITVGYNGVVYNGGPPDSYHLNSRNGYYAIDFDNPADFPEPKVLASAAGKVIKIYNDPLVGYGYGVKLDHGNGYESVYGHFKSRPSVVLNQKEQ